MFYKHYFPVVYNPFKWYLIWHKLLFQASLSLHKFGCLPCFLGFKFPKCSLLKSNIHSKVYYTEFKLTVNRSQKGPIPSVILILMVGIRSRRSHLIRLFSLSFVILFLQEIQESSLSIIYRLEREGDNNSKTHQSNKFI